MKQSVDKIATALQKSMDGSYRKKPKAYETEAEVVRVPDDEDVIYVKIPGGVDETPVRRTISAKVGDKVHIKVTRNRAYVTGNYSSPPTDDTMAYVANENAYFAGQVANSAAEAAAQAIEDAGRAQIAAENAEASAEAAEADAARAADAAEAAEADAERAATAAESAEGDAADARDAAGRAQIDAAAAMGAADRAEGYASQASSNAQAAARDAASAARSADSALNSVSIVEDVVGTLNWISEHGSYVITSDTTVQNGTVYFTYNSTTQDYEPIVQPDPTKNPHNEGWYVLDISEAQSDFIMSHLAVTGRGLWVLPNGIGSGTTPAAGETQKDSDARQGSGYKVLLSNSAMYIYDAQGGLVSTYGADILFSSDRDQSIGSNNAKIFFNHTNDQITISGNVIFNNVQAINNKVETSVYNNFTESVSSALTALQNQIDGQVEAWFYKYAPTTSNEPAVNWTTDTLKERHIGDIFYNVETYHSWRWMKSTVGGQTVYAWEQVPDSDASAALARANEAYSLADEKNKVIYAPSNPEPPYDENDLWFTGNAIWRCVQARVEGDTGALTDWVLTATDDTLAQEAKDLANSAAYEEQLIYCQTPSVNIQPQAVHNWVTASDECVFYELTSDTAIDPVKTYFKMVGISFVPVESPVASQLSSYYEIIQTPHWSTKRPTYCASYPITWSAKQRKTVENYGGVGSITTSAPIVDDTTTIIDGNRIITGTLDAEQVNVINLDGQNIRAGTIEIGQVNSLQETLDMKLDGFFEVTSEIHGTNNALVDLAAHVYSNNVEITSNYPPECFHWYYKNENGEFPLNVFQNDTVNYGYGVDDLVIANYTSYDGRIVVYFYSTDVDYYIDSNGHVIMTFDGVDPSELGTISFDYSTGNLVYTNSNYASNPPGFELSNGDLHSTGTPIPVGNVYRREVTIYKTGALNAAITSKVNLHPNANGDPTFVTNLLLSSDQITLDADQVNLGQGRTVEGALETIESAVGVDTNNQKTRFGYSDGYHIVIDSNDQSANHGLSFWSGPESVAENRTAYIEGKYMTIPYTVVINAMAVGQLGGQRWEWQHNETTHHLTLKWIEPAT